jgi:hypothetical protein
MTHLFTARDTLTAARLGLASPPTWARNADTKSDASEAWQTATDPHNERGETCTAHFDYADVWTEYSHADPSKYSEGWEQVPILQGVSVVGGSAGNWTTTYHTRAEVAARLGEAWIADVEGGAE